MMRESEARTKWCPFGRQLVTLETGPINNRTPIQAANANRFQQENTGTLCFGSACMAWRSPNGIFGYCGLAGRDDR